jgi:DNA replication protein DnaC
VDENNNAIPCKCYQERIKRNKIEFANIPLAFKDIRLNSFHVGYYNDKKTITEVVNLVKYYLENLDTMRDEGIGIYFYSEVKGSGKTRLAASIANELIYEYGINTRFVTSLDIISEIKATWGNETEFSSESQLMKYLTTVDVLVIDDFGTEQHKEWLDDKFYQIINKRYIDKLITIFTSNYELNQLQYDSRIINRIVERVYQVHFPEESLRDGIATARQRKYEKECKDGKQNQNQGYARD